MAGKAIKTVAKIQMRYGQKPNQVERNEGEKKIKRLLRYWDQGMWRETDHGEKESRSALDDSRIAALQIGVERKEIFVSLCVCQEGEEEE